MPTTPSRRAQSARAGHGPHYIRKRPPALTVAHHPSAPRSPPTRAWRKTIDPLCWGSTHLSGTFLRGNRIGDDGGGVNGGESTEVEEVKHVLEVSDQSPPRDDTTPPNAAITELDLAAETANALDLLSAMFGEANADWGGAETVDSEVEMAGPDVDIPHPTPGPVESAIPAAHKSLGFQRVGDKSADDGQPRKLQHQHPQQPVLNGHLPNSRTCLHLGRRRSVSGNVRLRVSHKPCFCPSQASSPTSVTSISTRSSTLL